MEKKGTSIRASAVAVSHLTKCPCRSRVGVGRWVLDQEACQAAFSMQAKCAQVKAEGSNGLPQPVSQPTPLPTSRVVMRTPRSQRYYPERDSIAAGCCGRLLLESMLTKSTV